MSMFTQLFERSWGDVEVARKEAREKTNTDPSDAQKESGNYQKGKFWWNGIEISIENPKGSTRSGKDKNGKEWSIKMVADYGYFRRTESEADGDHIDCFIGPDLSSQVVYVVNQNNPDTGKFDEHKCVIGVGSEKEAKELYKASYTSSWTGFDSIHCMTVDQFREWLFNGDTSKPLNENAEDAEYNGKVLSFDDDNAITFGVVRDTGEIHVGTSADVPVDWHNHFYQDVLTHRRMMGIFGHKDLENDPGDKVPHEWGYRGLERSVSKYYSVSGRAWFLEGVLLIAFWNEPHYDDKLFKAIISKCPRKPSKVMVEVGHNKNSSGYAWEEWKSKTAISAERKKLLDLEHQLHLADPGQKAFLRKGIDQMKKKLGEGLHKSEFLSKITRQGDDWYASLGYKELGGGNVNPIMVKYL